MGSGCSSMILRKSARSGYALSKGGTLPSSQCSASDLIWLKLQRWAST